MPPPGQVSPGGSPPPGTPPSPGTFGGPQQQFPPGGEAPGPQVPQQRGGPGPDWGAPPEPAPAEDSDRSGPRTGVIVAVVLGSAAALVLVTLGAAFGLSWLSQSSGDDTYQVGDCVVQEGSEARVTSCDQEGAFEIVSQVDSRDQCPDPTEPTIEIGGDSPTFYCLASVAAGGTGEEQPDGEQSPAGGEDGSGGDGGSGGQ